MWGMDNRRMERDVMPSPENVKLSLTNLVAHDLEPDGYQKATLTSVLIR
jgi:hypothetical protein